MSKAKSLNGAGLMLWIGGKVVALSKSCSVQLQANTQDGDTKDDGKWAAPEVTGMSWNMNNESVDSADANRSNDLVYADLFDKMVAGAPITVTFGVPSNAVDSGVPDAGWLAPASGGYTGQAIITSLDRSGAKGSNASVTVSLQGVGSLTRNGGSGSGE